MLYGDNTTDISQCIKQDTEHSELFCLPRDMDLLHMANISSSGYGQ